MIVRKGFLVVRLSEGADFAEELEWRLSRQVVKCTEGVDEVIRHEEFFFKGG